MTAPASRPLWLTAGLFFLSGFAALLYQVIWQRILGIVSGIHVYSVTMIVTAFMAGLGLGSLAGGRLADRLSAREAVLAFATCELLIGGFALASPWLYYDVAYVRLSFLVRYPLALPFTHLALLLPPTLLMGASQPLLSRGMVAETARAARTVATLYGVNTLGAAAGAFTCVWYLIGAIGFVGTVRLGALLNFAVAAGAMFIGRRIRDGQPSPIDDRSADPAARAVMAFDTSPAGTSFGLAGWALIYGMSGFVALSFEILWFRTLDVAIKASPYTFGHLLGTFLLFLGLGSLAGTALVERARRPERVFFWGQWGIAVSAGLALVLLCRLPSDFPVVSTLYRYWRELTRVDPGLVLLALRNASAVPRASHVLWLAFLTYVVLPFWLLAMPTFLMGLTYAYVQKAVQTRLGEIGWRVGVIQTANIVGCILGSLLAGTVLLQYVGTSRSMSLLLLSGCLYAWLAGRGRSPRPRPALTLTAIMIPVLLALAMPASEPFWTRLHGATPAELVVAEDATAVVSLPVPPRPWTIMTVNGIGHGVIPFGGAHTLLGVLPTLVHPHIKEALIIGLGSGNTAWAAACAPTLERLDLYEIARPQVEVLQTFLQHVPAERFRGITNVLHDARIRIFFTDGRLALRTTEQTYDLIESDALERSMAFSGNLYSREFFELCRTRLKPGGVLCTYVPSERTRQAVVSAFPYLLDLSMRGYPSFILASDRPIHFDRVSAETRLRDPGVQAYFDRAAMNPGTTELLEKFLAGATATEIDDANRGRFLDGNLNTDLFPRDEFDKTFVEFWTQAAGAASSAPPVQPGAWPAPDGPRP